MSMVESNEGQRSQVDDDEIDLSALFGVIRFRKNVLFSVALLVLTLGMLLVLQLEPKYTAASNMMIGVPKTNVVDVEAVLSGQLGGDEQINGEMEVIKSRVLAEKIVERLGLLDKEEFNPSLRPPGLLSYVHPKNLIPAEYHGVLGLEAKPLTEEEQAIRTRTQVIDAFIARLNVTNVKRSNVVQVGFESKDPKLAARIANEIPEAYIVGNMEAKFEATERATKWLDEQLGDLKEKLEASETAVEDYKIEHGISEGARDSIIQEQMSEINVQLAKARADRAEAEAKLSQVRRLLGGNELALETSSEVLRSPLIQNLRQQEVQVLRKRSELSAEFGKKHPKMMQVEAELTDLRTKIASEVQKIAGALANEVQVALSRENSLKSSLKDLEKESGITQTALIQLRSLEREARSNRTLFDTFLERFKETSSTQNMQEADARVISRADVPVEPSFPKVKLMFAVIVIMALFLGLIAVFIVEALANGVFTPEQVEAETGFPVIGIIPLSKSKSPEKTILESPHSSYSEAFNTFRTSLFLSDPDRPLKVIAVTSSLPEEGKSTLVLSLATNVAQSGKKVLIVDTDIRRAVIDKKTGVVGTKGLTDFLADEERTLSEYITKHEETGVYLMPKGQAKYVNATDLLASQRMEKAVKVLRQNFDFIIMDTPPVMAVTDARIIAKMVDKTVFVVRWSKTPRKVVESALEQLRKARIDIAGIVLQQTDINKQKSYYYGSNYSAYYYHYHRYGHYYKS